MDAAWYAGAQVLAGVVAALACRFVIVAKPEAAPAAAGRALAAAIVVEVLFTFALAYTVLNVATSKAHPNNSFYGLAIGLVVLAGATAVGGISGGAFNPAVGLGVIVAGLASWQMLWVYLFATLLGGALAGYVFRYLNPDDVDKRPAITLPKKVPAGRRASPDPRKEGHLLTAVRVGSRRPSYSERAATWRGPSSLGGVVRRNAGVGDQRGKRRDHDRAADLDGQHDPVPVELPEADRRLGVDPEPLGEVGAEDRGAHADQQGDDYADALTAGQHQPTEHTHDGTDQCRTDDVVDLHANGSLRRR